MTTRSDYTPQTEDLAKKYAVAIQKRWRQVKLSVRGPKYHSLSHFAEHMKRDKGLGSFNEQFMEVAHKVGNVDLRCVGPIKDQQQRALSISKFNSSRSLPGVDAACQKLSQNPIIVAQKKRARESTLLEVTELIESGRDTVMEDYWNKSSS